MERPLPWALSLVNEWLAERVAAEGTDELASEFVIRLASQALRTTPSVLLNESIVEEFGSRESPKVTGPHTLATLQSMLAFLLDLGVWLGNRDEIIFVTEASAASLEETLEIAYKRLRSIYLEICLNERDRTSLGDISDEFETEQRRQLFEARGVLLPTLLFSTLEAIPPGWASIKINDRVGLPQPLVEPSATPTLDSVLDLLQAEGSRDAHLFLAVPEVELQLARLHESHPVLVQTVLADFTAATLTGCMRSLVSEGVSVRDLKTVLDRLLETVSGRLQSAGSGRPAASRSYSGSGLELADSVRGRLALQLMGQYAPNGLLAAIVVDTDLEQRFFGSGDVNGHSEVGEDERRMICAQLREMVRESKANTPVLLTRTAGARRQLRQIVAAGLGDLPVLALGELDPRVIVEEVGTLAL